MRRMSLVLLTLCGLALAQVQDRVAVITEFRQVQGTWTVRLDYVEIKECGDEDCTSGFRISNQNPLIRSFRFTRSTRILLLKNAGEYFQATPQQLIQGRAGRDFGWSFGKTNPFYIKVDEAKREILELRQMYLP